MRLTSRQRHLLLAMVGGATLRVHRTLDGEKAHRLQPLEGEPEAVDSALVESLIGLGLVQSNFKFPAATYVLTDQAFEELS